MQLSHITPELDLRIKAWRMKALQKLIAMIIQMINHNLIATDRESECEDCESKEILRP